MDREIANAQGGKRGIGRIERLIYIDLILLVSVEEHVTCVEVGRWVVSAMYRTATYRNPARRSMGPGTTWWRMAC
jgi:hypothetical protein